VQEHVADAIADSAAAENDAPGCRCHGCAHLRRRD
jgi:hypothetical protein